MNLDLLCEQAFGQRPRQVFPAGGGCIARAFRLELPDGRRVFAKTLAGADPFPAEAMGLRALQVPGGVRVPEVLHLAPGALFLEWITFRTPPPGFQRELGRRLATTHRKTADSFGFDLDHVIGSTPQKNTPQVPFHPGAWAAFWWEYRLEPMIRRLPGPLASRFAALESRITALLDGTDEPPSILHGDLWSGNAACDESGAPVFFDPAAYYGRREADLSMTRMFGGFHADFYAAYHEAHPLQDGWSDRLDFYMLYHVLNHVVLFGNSYLAQAEQILKRFV